MYTYVCIVNVLLVYCMLILTKDITYYDESNSHICLASVPGNGSL